MLPEPVDILATGGRSNRLSEDFALKLKLQRSKGSDSLADDRATVSEEQSNRTQESQLLHRLQV